MEQNKLLLFISIITVFFILSKNKLHKNTIMYISFAFMIGIFLLDNNKTYEGLANSNIKKLNDVESQLDYYDSLLDIDTSNSSENIKKWKTATRRKMLHFYYEALIAFGKYMKKETKSQGFDYDYNTVKIDERFDEYLKLIFEHYNDHYKNSTFYKKKMTNKELKTFYEHIFFGNSFHFKDTNNTHCPECDYYKLYSDILKNIKIHNDIKDIEDKKKIRHKIISDFLISNKTYGWEF